MATTVAPVTATAATIAAARLDRLIVNSLVSGHSIGVRPLEFDDGRRHDRAEWAGEADSLVER